MATSVGRRARTAASSTFGKADGSGFAEALPSSAEGRRSWSPRVRCRPRAPGRSRRRATTITPAPPPSAATDPTSDRRSRRTLRTATAVEVTPSADRSSETNAAQLGKRSADDFAIPLAMTASTASGRSGRAPCADGGGSRRMAVMRAASLSRSYGRCPVSARWAIAAARTDRPCRRPRAPRAARGPCSRACP